MGLTDAVPPKDGTEPLPPEQEPIQEPQGADAKPPGSPEPVASQPQGAVASIPREVLQDLSNPNHPNASQFREAQASLQRQLDGLRGQLEAAEKRAALAEARQKRSDMTLQRFGQRVARDYEVDVKDLDAIAEDAWNAAEAEESRTMQGYYQRKAEGDPWVREWEAFAAQAQVNPQSPALQEALRQNYGDNIKLAEVLTDLRRGATQPVAQPPPPQPQPTQLEQKVEAGDYVAPAPSGTPPPSPPPYADVPLTDGSRLMSEGLDALFGKNKKK